MTEKNDAQVCKLDKINTTYFEQTTMLFRQSPYNASEILVLTEGSRIYKVCIQMGDNLRETQAELFCTFDLELQ